MRIAIVYDCVYPHTVGGAERWLRALAESLGEQHEVTYLTRRQWERGEEPRIPGVSCVAVSPAGDLYTDRGRRRLLPAIQFAFGVCLHFLRHRRSYEIVHCVSYPFVPLIALRLALIPNRRTRLYVEWLEYLSRDYWRAYAGRVGGAAGRLLQRLCLRLSPAAFVFSRFNERRLREAGYRRELHRLPGLWLGERDGPAGQSAPTREPLVLFAGRHVPDKRVSVVPDAIERARRSVPEVRAVIAGDGPERARVLARIEELGLADVVDAPGFVERAEFVRLLQSATCLVAPSIRDGYGMAVVEAAAAGLPVVVCRNADNASTEFVEEGVNGVVARDSSAEAVAGAIVRAIAEREALHRTTREWFAAHAAELTIDSSLTKVRALYSGGTHTGAAGSAEGPERANPARATASDLSGGSWPSA